MQWEEEFAALTDEQKAKVRHCARHFGVPLMHAFLRAQSLGLIPAPDRAALTETKP